MSGQMGERAARIVMSEIRGNLVFRDRNSSEFHVISGSDLSFVRTEVHDLFFAVRNEVRFFFPEFHSALHYIFVRTSLWFWLKCIMVFAYVSHSGCISDHDINEFHSALHCVFVRTSLVFWNEARNEIRFFSLHFIPHFIDFLSALHWFFQLNPDRICFEIHARGKRKNAAGHEQYPWRDGRRKVNRTKGTLANIASQSDSSCKTSSRPSDPFRIKPIRSRPPQQNPNQNFNVIARKYLPSCPWTYKIKFQMQKEGRL